MGDYRQKGGILSAPKQENRVWLNGDLVPESQAHISLFDRGYLYGDGLFETMRAYDGKVFRLEQHWLRLVAAGQAIELSIPLSLKEISSAVADLLKANNLADAYLRLTVSRGIGLGPLPEANLTPTLSIIARPLHLPSAKEYQKGWRGLLVATSLAPGSLQSGLKSLSYLDKISAKLQARRGGAKEAILFNSAGQVTEGATSNIFLVKNDRLLTPALESGLLPGITRRVIFDLAKDLELPSAEIELNPQDIFSAQECFLTNSLLEIMPLVGLDEKAIAGGFPGPVTGALQAGYRRLVQEDIGFC
jgi:branched-chain amino acid aminotransferase